MQRAVEKVARTPNRKQKTRGMMLKERIQKDAHTDSAFTSPQTHTPRTEQLDPLTLH